MNRTLIIFVLAGVLACVGSASADLVGWWKFDEGSGIVAADSSGSGLDASIEGPVWTEGHSGSALAFNGSDSLVRIPEFTTGQVQTVAAWIKIDSVESGGRQIFNGNGPPHMNFEVFDGQIKGRVYTGSGNIELVGPAVPVGVWTHLAWVWDFTANRSELYIDGVSVALGEASSTIEHTSESVIGRHPSATTASFLGAIDEVRVYDHALDLGEIQAAMIGNTGLSMSPNPKNDAEDVIRDVVLDWQPGEFAVTHDVYIGTSFEDVNAATVPTAAGQDANVFDAGRLELETTYYWRVDEVNGAPDHTVFKGDVWNFTVEPYSIPLPGSAITVTASSASNDFSTPEKTIDGSGLDADGTHAIDPQTMWFTAAVDLDPWIQFEFDAVKKLDTMTVWNANSSAEPAIGWGIKDVEIAYSVDGENWEVLADANQLSRAPGQPTYNQFDTVDFKGAAAKYVRLNIQSNWGGILMAYGLSEVQFSTIPVRVRTPEPATGAVDLAPDTVATWRAGREAGQHRIYVSPDMNAVADGTAPSVTTSVSSLDLMSLDLELGLTYYWRVDEVNEAQAVPVWTGPVWRFTTTDAIVVDDFEGYNNLSPDRPFQTWLDGIGYSADEFFAQAYGGNGTGAAIGHDIWSLASPHYNGDIMETSNTAPGSSQAMPFYYTNTGGTASESQRSFAGPQDWTTNGIQSLSLMFFGDPDNTGQLYLKIGNTKVSYTGLSDALQRAQWMPWTIDLAATGADLTNVSSLTLGIDGANASGSLLIDEILLTPLTAQTITPVVPDDSDPSLAAYYAFEGSPADARGNFPGTVVGDPLYVAGKTGQAISFDGTDDWVVNEFDQEEVWPAFGVSLWVRTDIFAQEEWRSPFNNNSTTGPDFQLDVDGSDPGNYRYNGVSAGQSLLGPVTSDWVHLAATSDGTQTRVYYNGLHVATLPGADNNFARIGIGINRGLNEPFAGSIDEVRVYNRALTAAEVAGLSGITEAIPAGL